MSVFKVALVGLDGQTAPGWVAARLAQEDVEFSVKECTTADELARQGGDADVIWVFGGTRVVTAERLALLPRCGAIVRTGSGTDNIPVGAATERGILVANTPGALADAVSDHAIGLLFAVLRQIVVQDRAVRKGIWDRHLAWPRWHLRGRTLGLIGFGHIARLVARKLQGFELNTLAYDPLVDPQVMAGQGVRGASLDELLREADFVSLHCPLTKDTFHLLDEARLRSMKPEAILINTARGPLVDERALVQALKEGWLAAAGLDVLEEEPPAAGHPLVQLDNVVLTPHIAAYSDDYLDSCWRWSVETVLALARGRWPASCVNPDVKPRWPLSRGETAGSSIR
jgi:D-3-phosphoglycerate dehydrogenase